MAIKKESVNIQNLLISGGVVLLLVAGYFYFKPKKTKQPEVVNPEEIIVQEEGAVKKTGDEVQPLNEEEIKKIKEEVDGVLASAGQKAKLKGISGNQAKGEAKKAFSDGKFYLKITANNLAPVEKGFYYQGWLNKGEDYFSVGRMETDSQGQAKLYYTASTNKPDYNKVIVTLEPEDDNPAPAKPVLEGEFSGLNI